LGVPAPEACDDDPEFCAGEGEDGAEYEDPDEGAEDPE